MASGDYKRNLTELLRAGGYEAEEGVPYSEKLSNLSVQIQRRVRALKQYQLESVDLESKFYERVHQLEIEFQSLFSAVYEKRKRVITGEHEPTDDECKLPLVHGLTDEELQKLETDSPVEGKPSKGVPEFWYQVFDNVGQIADMIYEYDVPVLKHLTDVTSEVHDNPPSFTLLFHFEENPFFTNKVLKKYYELKLTYDEEDPFDYDGPSVVKSQGQVIDWKEGKNVTQKVVKKKQKKGPNAGKFSTKTVSNESFFNFFDNNVKVLDENAEQDVVEEVRNDFEVGQLIRDHVIPRAVLFFTGEAADDEDDFFGEDAGDEEDDGGSESGEGN